MQEEEDLVSAWWKEYAECSEGPAASQAASPGDGSPAAESAEASRDYDHGSRVSSSKHQFVFEPEEESVGVLVKGGLYEVTFLWSEHGYSSLMHQLSGYGGLFVTCQLLFIKQVDLVKRRCSPVYWKGDNMRVLRGHWFARRTGLDWLPLREDIAEQLESAYASQVYLSFLCCRTI